VSSPYQKIVYIVRFFFIMWQVINDSDEGVGNTRSVKHNMKEEGGEPLPSPPIVILMFLLFVSPLPSFCVLATQASRSFAT